MHVPVTTTFTIEGYKIVSYKASSAGSSSARRRSSKAFSAG